MKQAKQLGEVKVVWLMAIVCALSFVFLIRRVRESDEGDRPSAAAQIGAIEMALTAYETDTGKFPAQPNGLAALFAPTPGVANWHAPYLSSELSLDPWGRKYEYKFPGAHNPSGYDLWTKSPQGVLFANWKTNK